MSLFTDIHDTAVAARDIDAEVKLVRMDTGQLRASISSLVSVVTQLVGIATDIDVELKQVNTNLKEVIKLLSPPDVTGIMVKPGPPTSH